MSGDPLAITDISEFVGQESAKALVSMEVAAARAGQPVGHFLAWGNLPGTGKTTLARITSCLLDLPILELHGSQLETISEAYSVLGRLPRIAEPFLLLIDEISSAGRAATTLIHSIMAEGMFDARDGRRLPLQPAVVWLTSNSLAQIPEPLVSRCKTILHFLPYADSELTQLAAQSAHHLGVEITSEAATEIAYYSLGAPRTVNHYVLSCRSYCLATNRGSIELPVVHAVLDLLRIYPGGVDEAGLNILRFLSGRRKASLQSIAGSLFLDARDVKEKLEIPLIRNGLIEIASGGRAITSFGRSYLSKLEERRLA